ncbi:MAG: hypothetical protein VKO65_09810 [Cyanobacteriota bacterium]|nr:hypothetical protein [Cyanobacteriota bacterium]
MASLRCPTCAGLPLRVLSQPGSGSRGLRCGRCGGRLQRRGWAVPITLVLTGATATLALAALPDVLDSAASLAARNAVLPRLLVSPLPVPEPGEQPLALLRNGLFEELSLADEAWIPIAEPLPNGATRYRYRRRPGEPELSLDQIRERIANPPTFDTERQAVADTLQALQTAGVRLVLETPRKGRAAGEWDHGERTLRVKPDVVRKGSLEFARVLNHEAIHVAQSCAGGSLEATPTQLGLDATLTPELREQLEDPLYTRVSEKEKALEREAYAHQDRLGIGATLIRRHCPKRA